MPVHDAATKACSNRRGIEASHADHDKPPLPTIAVAGEISIDTPANGLDNIGQGLAGNGDPSLGTQDTEIRCQRGNHRLKSFGIINLIDGDDMRGEFVMSMIMMVMIIIMVIVMVIIVMMVVVMHMG